MSVTCPLRSRCLLSLVRISVKRSLSVLSVSTTKDGHPRSSPKSPSKILQMFVKEPILSSNDCKNNQFLHCLRTHLDRILHNRMSNILKTLEKDGLQGETLDEFNEFVERMGMQELSEGEMSRMVSHLSAVKPYMSINRSFDYLKMYVSNKDVSSLEERNIFNRFFSKPFVHNRVLILCRQSKNKRVILKSFVNLTSNKLLATLPGSEVWGDVLRKIFISSLVGLSLGSAASSAVLEIFYLPTDLFVAMTATSIFLSSYVWGILRTGQSSLLLDKIRTLYGSSGGDGVTLAHSMARRVVPNVLLEVLSVYSFLLREKNILKKKGETFEHLLIDDAFQRNFKKWMSDLSGFEHRGDCLDNTLHLLEELEMIRVKDDSSMHLEVVPFEEVLTALVNRPVSFSNGQECLF